MDKPSEPKSLERPNTVMEQSKVVVNPAPIPFTVADLFTKPKPPPKKFETFSHASNDSSEAYSVEFYNDSIKDDLEQGAHKEEQGQAADFPRTTKPESARPLNPVLKLTKCERFCKPAVGSILKLKFIRPKAHQALKIPLFELAEKSGHYDEMQDQMHNFYRSFNPQHILHSPQIHKGHFAVLMDQSDNNPWTRIKFLAEPKKDYVKVEMIDYYFEKKVDLQSRIVYLDSAFANLPPRVSAIEMEGMSHYLDHRIFKDFVSRDSEEFLFKGELTAEVQASGKVLVWNERFPRHEHPYGVNGHFVKTMIDILQEPKLPPLLGQTGDVYVEHVESSGINVRFQTSTGDHFLAVFTSVSQDDITKFKGTVKPASAVKGNDEKYLAPYHELREVNYYRAKIETRLGPEKVLVLFIDYGNEATVNISDLVLCKDIHPLLALFPPQQIKVKLQNISFLNADAYYRKYLNRKRNQPYFLQVMQEATKVSLAEVALWPKNDYQLAKTSINEEIAKNQVGEAINPEYKPETAVEYTRSSAIEFRLHFELSGGRHLKPGMTVEVIVFYRDCMENICFVYPYHQQNQFEDFVTAMDADYQLPWNKEPSSTTVASYTEGSGQLCFSFNVMSVARALLISERVRRPFEGDQEITSSWEVYLVDYGVFEIVKLQDFRSMLPKFFKPPVFGVRARFAEFDTQKKIQNWISTWGRDKKRFNVVVQSISEDQLGEIVELEVKKGRN